MLVVSWHLKINYNTFFTKSTLYYLAIQKKGTGQLEL